MQGVNAIEYLRAKTLEGDYSFHDKNKIAASIDAQVPFLARTLMHLARRGVVETKSGPSGGVRIDKAKLEKWKLLEVIRVLGQTLPEPGGDRASDRLNIMVYDILDLTLEEYLSM